MRGNKGEGRKEADSSTHTSSSLTEEQKKKILEEVRAIKGLKLLFQVPDPKVNSNLKLFVFGGMWFFAEEWCGLINFRVLNEVQVGVFVRQT